MTMEGGTVRQPIGALECGLVNWRLKLTDRGATEPT